MPDPEFDDVDRAFAIAGNLEPPAGLLQRVMLQVRSEPAPVQAYRPRSLMLAYGVIYLLGLASLGILAFQFGISAAHNGITVLLGTLAGNAELLADAPTAYAGALLASIPWLHLAALAFDLAILAIIARLSLRPFGSTNAEA
jgi:hypothetical protein